MHPFVGEAMVEIQEMHLRLDQLRAIENLQAALEPLDVPALQVTEAGHLPLKQRWFQPARAGAVPRRRRKQALCRARGGTAGRASHVSLGSSSQVNPD